MSSSVGRHVQLDAVPAQQLRGAEPDDLRLAPLVGHHRDADEVEPALERRGQVVDAAVAAVGGGDDREAGLGEDDVVARRARGSRCTSRTGSRSARPGRRWWSGSAPRSGRSRRCSIAVMIGEGIIDVAGLALGDDHRDVPRVLDVVLGGAGGALHDQRGVAADGRGQQLGEPALAGAGVADQQQAAVGGQRDDGCARRSCGRRTTSGRSRGPARRRAREPRTNSRTIRGLTAARRTAWGRRRPTPASRAPRRT